MARNKPNEFDTMDVLHYLWKNKHLSLIDVRHFLLTEYSLRIVHITEDSIEAESLDKKTKYSLK
jgi:hypothetical protein